MPTDDAPDEAWEAWAAAEEFEAMLAGMVGRPREPRDQAFVVQLRHALGAPSLQSKPGDRLAIAESLVEALAERRL